MIEAELAQALRKAALGKGNTVGRVVIIDIVGTVPERLHQLGGRVAQMIGNRLAGTLAYDLAGLLPGHIGGVALGRDGQVDHRLGQRQFALRTAQPLITLPGIEHDRKRTRIGIADVLAGCAQQTAGQILRIATAVEHAAEPVQRGIRVAAADALVQCRDLIKEGITLLVEATPAISQQGRQQIQLDSPVLGQIGRRFEQGQRSPRIAIGGLGQRRLGLYAHGYALFGQA